MSVKDQVLCFEILRVIMHSAGRLVISKSIVEVILSDAFGASIADPGSPFPALPASDHQRSCSSTKLLKMWSVLVNSGVVRYVHLVVPSWSLCLRNSLKIATRTCQFSQYLGKKLDMLFDIAMLVEIFIILGKKTAILLFISKLFITCKNTIIAIRG